MENILFQLNYFCMIDSNSMLHNQNHTSFEMNYTQKKSGLNYEKFMKSSRSLNIKGTYKSSATWKWKNHFFYWILVYFSKYVTFPVIFIGYNLINHFYVCTVFSSTFINKSKMFFSLNVLEVNINMNTIIYKIHMIAIY